MLRKSVREHYGILAAAILLLVLAGELTLSIRNQSLSWDEGDHLFAGYMSWKTADFGINPEHPPLVKALAALPLLPMHLVIPAPKHLGFFKDEAYFDGRDLIFNNGGEPQADRIIFRARMAAATITLLLGTLVFVAGREMFGTAAALFALALIVFEPNMIAHGAYVTTDMGVTCFLFAAVYALYRYRKSPSWQRLLTLGLAIGLALAAKHSAVLMLPMGIALAITEIVWPRSRGTNRETRLRAAVNTTAALLAASVIGIFVLWASYHFRYAAKPAGIPLSPSLAEYAHGLQGIEPRLYLAIAHWHLLPESYLYGLIDVRLVSNSFPSYIFGKVYAHGVWFYFPAAFVIKSTAAFLILLLITGIAITTGKLRPLLFGVNRELIFLTIAPAIYLTVAMATGLNIGARHILPMYPFLAVLIGGALALLAKTDRRWTYLAAALLAWHMVSSARACPVYLAYSNEFFGGPDNTYKYLTDSNTDWGQQLKAVHQYVETHHVTSCWFAYFVEPEIHFSAYGIPCRPLPTADTGWTHYQVDTPLTITGPVFISAGTLTGYEFGSRALNPYSQFEALRPVAIIEHGVFVYEGTFDMRFAAALGHVTRALDLTTAKQLPAALQEAETAAAVDPDEFQAQMTLGDTLTALGRKAAARPAYEEALKIAATMEPSAAKEWIPKIKAKM